MSSCCGHFQLHQLLWLLDHIGNSLIWLALVINKDRHLKFHINRILFSLHPLLARNETYNFCKTISKSILWP